MTLQAIIEETKSDFSGQCSIKKAKKMINKLEPIESGSIPSIIDLVYPRLDLGFLKQRDNKGYPKFAVFTSESPYFSIRSDSNKFQPDAYVYDEKSLSRSDRYLQRLFEGGLNRYDNSVQREMAIWFSENFFSDVFDNLHEKCMSKIGKYGRLRKTIHIGLHQEFNGIIPDSVRDDIKKSEKILNGGTFIIADAGEWSFDEMVVTKTDPLVIKFFRKQAFLISAFDVVSAEEIVAREFSDGEVSKIINKAKKNDPMG